MLAAFFACVVVAVLFVRATCPGPVVYLRSAEVADALARRGITPEMTEQALKQGLDLASFFTAASLRGAFAEEGGRVTDAKSFAEKRLSLDGRETTDCIRDDGEMSNAAFGKFSVARISTLACRSTEAIRYAWVMWRYEAVIRLHPVR